MKPPVITPEQRATVLGDETPQCAPRSTAGHSSRSDLLRRPAVGQANATLVRLLANKAVTIIGATQPQLKELSRIVPKLCEELSWADPGDQVLQQFTCGLADFAMDLGSLDTLRQICRTACDYGMQRDSSDQSNPSEHNHRRSRT